MKSEVLEKNIVNESAEKPEKKKRSKKKIILISSISFVLVLCIAVMSVVVILMKQNFSRGEYSEYTAYYRYDHYSADYPREEVSFKSGENTLKGWIYGGENNKGLVVVAHGIGGGHEGYINEIIWLVNHGWKVFAYDATGSCESEGDGTNGLPQSALDLDCALTFAENDTRLSGMPVFLFGHSWGGYAVTAVLNFDHEIAASASIAGYSDPMEMMTEFTERMMGNATYAVYPFMWIYNKWLFGGYSDLSAIDGINNSDTPVLIIHGNEDAMISYDRSSIISKRNKIVNPNVEYITYSEQGINGHSSIFNSKNSVEYIEKINKDYEQLFDKYNGEIPDSEIENYYASVDREKVNAVNDEMLNSINEFYEKYL